jgi:hypothetical protein
MTDLKGKGTRTVRIDDSASEVGLRGYLLQVAHCCYRRVEPWSTVSKDVQPEPTKLLPTRCGRGGCMGCGSWAVDSLTTSCLSGGLAAVN